MEELKKVVPYDIIGDVHGCAAELEAILIQLGYREEGAYFKHSGGRRVIFLGDYIDRGPQVQRTLEIVRSMVDAGQALAILGNHEVNALRFHQKDRNGNWLRPHTESKVHQHQATLDQIAHPSPSRWKSWLDWFTELPLWLEMPGIRVVHAAWLDGEIALLKGHKSLRGEELIRLSQKGSPEATAVERILCGVELALPPGESFSTPDGAERREFRARWWDDLTGLTCREAAFPADERLPGTLCSPPDWHQPYSIENPPVFFGHFAVMNEQPRPMASNVACLDYGMGKNGSLVAYRWDGESILSTEKFLSIETEVN